MEIATELSAVGPAQGWLGSCLRVACRREEPRRKARAGAFSLVELLIAVVLLGVLAAIIIPRFIVSADEAKKNACAQNVARINQMVEKWHLDKGSWPSAEMVKIGKDPAYFPEGIPRCPVDGSKYLLHGETHRVAPHQH